MTYGDYKQEKWWEARQAVFDARAAWRAAEDRYVVADDRDIDQWSSQSHQSEPVDWDKVQKCRDDKATAERVVQDTYREYKDAVLRARILGVRGMKLEGMPPSV